MAYGNPRFSELGRVLTKVTLERSRIFLCSLDWRAHEENEYWRTLFEKVTLTSMYLTDGSIYVPLRSRSPIREPR